MLEILVEKLRGNEEENPDATIKPQLYERDDRPLVIASVTPFVKRVHKEISQYGECVYVDSTSNTEEHSLKVFVLRTHSVVGALSCAYGILITISDEQESTLKKGFEML